MHINIYFLALDKLQMILCQKSNFLNIHNRQYNSNFGCLVSMLFLNIILFISHKNLFKQ